MNRKQRRASSKTGPAGGAVPELFARASQCHREGRLADAERLYRQVPAGDPRHADSLHRLGVIAYQTGRHAQAEALLRKAVALDARAAYLSHLGLVLSALDRLDEAVACCRSAIEREPGLADAHNNLGVALMRLGRAQEAAGCYAKAIALQPGLPDLHNNLGNALLALDRPGEAAASYRNALALAPDFVEAHNNLGNALLDQDLAEEAGAHYRHAIALAPGFADSHNNLGNALWRLGWMAEAQTCYRTAIGLDQGFAKAHGNLGGILKSAGRNDEAIAAFRRALEIDPGQAEILANLASALLAGGDHAGAMDAITRSLALKETPAGRRIFVQCAKDLHFEQEAGPLAPLLLRALCEGWDRPDDLARVSAACIKQDPDVAALVARANAAGPGGARALDGDPGFAALSRHRLLEALLCRTQNLDIELERLLTAARRALLHTAMAAREDDGAPDAALDFHSALARQCFINEYVFFHDDEELALARQLRDQLVGALQSGAVIPPRWIAALAAYFPLSSLPDPGLALDRTWPEPVAALLVQQIQEPQEEQQLRATIPRLMTITDAVSHLVRAQYEENPYPRWTQAGTAGPPEDLLAHLRRIFPHDAIESAVAQDGADILVAGCGTGRNAVETAQRFKGARVLAVDLSLNSLGHAARKTRACGVRGIEYAQADLLELGALERRFDMIEAVGVLHHLADPYAGWRVLLSLLRPGGFMMLGLYSRHARRALPALRARLAARGYGPGADDVRRARRDLIDTGDGGDIAMHPDFFGISTCRDLLFHVQEQHMTLGDIDAFLRGDNLKFLGFSLDEAVLTAYRQRYPDDSAATDLGRWQEFETDNRDVFSGMYQFWLQKAV